MTKDDKALRQRSKNVSSNTAHKEPKPDARRESSANQQEQDMGRRGPVIAYSRGGTVATSRGQTLSNYKNKILIALGATILYTAFLYRSGTYDYY